MSAGDFALVIVSVVVFACFSVMLVAVMMLWRILGEVKSMVADLRGAIATLHTEALPRMDEMVGELKTTVVEAGAEVDRVDGLLEAAETISARVDSASRLGYLAFRAPLIRFVALLEGIRRGFRRLIGFGDHAGNGRPKGRDAVSANAALGARGRGGHGRHRAGSSSDERAA